MLSSPNISSHKSFKLAYSLSSILIKIVPAGFKRAWAILNLFSIKEIHLLCEYPSCRSTNASSYTKSLCPVLYGGSIYITSIFPLYVFSNNLSECRLSPSKRKLYCLFSESPTISLSSTSVKTGICVCIFTSTSSSCSSHTSPYFFAVSSLSI